MSIITIHQIEHIPHNSLFKKFNKADIIVLGDTFQFKKNYFENRNKIVANNKDGWQWITVPVEKDNHKSISEVKIIQDGKWQEKYLGTLYNAYHNSKGFPAYYYPIKQIIEASTDSLIHLNVELMLCCLEWLEIRKDIVYLSDLKINPELKATDLLVEICKKCHATTYISGPSGKDYLELDKFGSIEVQFHEKEPGLSVIHDLFTKGEVQLCG